MDKRNIAGEKMNILIATPMLDAQSGPYVLNSCILMKHKVAYFDWRHLTKDKGVEGMNKEFLEATRQLKPDLTIILKGLGIMAETIKKAKEIHNHPIVGWMFDVTLGGIYIKDVPQYIDFIKTLDRFYTIDNDAVPELKALGVNAEWLSEGCFEPDHKEAVINSIQKRKWGADIVFLGAVGSIHPNREKFLSRLHKDGYKFKIYGGVLYAKDKEPLWVKDHHTGFSAINDQHSIVCNSSKVVLGLDGWPHRDKSYSARLYRTLCAGAFYLTTHTKGIEEAFKPGVHLDTFKTEDEMIEKLVKYLMDDELREKIAKEGQKEVLEKHQFKYRIQHIIESFI